MSAFEYIKQYLLETKQIADCIDQGEVAAMVDALSKLKQEEGRLFILGVGGSAANASHAVNDFRKIAGIEAYAPTDNTAELTARTNDEGWEYIFSQWLKTSKISAKDVLLVLSVGGGSAAASMNIQYAVDLAKDHGAKVIGIVSRDGGYTKCKADTCVLVPVVADERITPHAESWQGVIWHLIVNALVA